MKPLKTKAQTRPAEPEQESYPVYCIELAIEEFLNHARGLNRSLSTIERHSGALGKLCRLLQRQGIDADKADISTLTPQIMADYQAWLYQAKSRYGRPYGLMSQIVMLNSLQVFGKFLVTSGRLLRNPAEVLKLPREPRRLPGTILSSKEMKRLLRQPNTSTVLGFRDRTMYEVLYSTGLRISELIGMRVQDLTLSQETIFIPETKHYKDRCVPIGATACRYLAEYLKRVRPLLIRVNPRSTCPPKPPAKAGSVVPSPELVFLSRLGRMLDDGGVQQKLRIYATRAGIEKHLTVHVFRHTLATDMLRRGADLRQIQELLGHRQLTTTQIYTHIVKGELKRVQAHCHPREQVDLPEGFTAYRGRDYLTPEERSSEKRNSHPVNPVDPVRR